MDNAGTILIILISQFLWYRLVMTNDYLAKRVEKNLQFDALLQNYYNVCRYLLNHRTALMIIYVNQRSRSKYFNKIIFK